VIGVSAPGFGGAIYADNAAVNFMDSAVHFTSNAATGLEGSGGAIYAKLTSKINFTNSAVNFTNNAATGLEGSGGAIYASNRLNINFTNSVVHFTSNAATGLEGKGGAIYAESPLPNININFTNSAVNFTNNSASYGAAIYIEKSTISFINTNASFIGNSGESALYAKNSQIKISGDMEFNANTNGDIGLENSDIVFMPESGKTTRFKGNIADKGGSNEILKVGEGALILSSMTPIHLRNANFLIAQGIAHFSASSNTFNEIAVSSAGILGISIDFMSAKPLISAFYVGSFDIADGSALSVKTNGIAAIGTSASFVYSGDNMGSEFENMNIIGLGGYDYSLSLDNTKKVGFLTLEKVPQILPPTLFNISPIFIANAIRQAAISDNSPIYSNIKEQAWVAVQINGGNLADDDLGDFKNSAAGAKGGYRVFDKEGKTAGVFAGVGSRSYGQGGNKASATDMDFGAYGSLTLVQKVGLAGFLGFGLQSVKAEGGGASADFDATVVKFGARAEMSAGLISPFLGLEGAIVKTDDVNLGGATLEAGEYTRLSSQIGAKIARQAGKLAWYGRAYVDLLLAGAKPQYSVKPDNDGARIPIDGTAENAASFGLGAGGSLPVSNAIDVFANADIKLGGDYFGYQTNIGGRVRF
jgi:predicted outer membrane repeat protein